MACVDVTCVVMRTSAVERMVFAVVLLGLTLPGSVAAQTAGHEPGASPVDSSDAPRAESFAASEENSGSGEADPSETETSGTGSGSRPILSIGLGSGFPYLVHGAVSIWPAEILSLELGMAALAPVAGMTMHTGEKHQFLLNFHAGYNLFTLDRGFRSGVGLGYGLVQKRVEFRLLGGLTVSGGDHFLPLPMAIFSVNWIAVRK